ncbi:TPA: lipopolysaccharide biosynthesis protein, partial [Vibrio cholerae]
MPLIISKLFRVEFNWLWLISLTALSYYIVAIFQQVICWYCGYIRVGISKNVMMISKKALKYSVPLMGSLFIIWSLSSFDKLILQQIVSEYDLGLYVNAFRFASVGLLLQQLVSTIWSPLSIKWYLKNPNPEAFKITLNISVMMSIVIYLISILLLPFLKYTMHEDFYESLDI